MSWLSTLPNDLKKELDYYRCFELRDIINEQFKVNTITIYGPSREYMMNRFEEARAMLFIPIVEIDLILNEHYSEAYEIFVKIKSIVTFDKLLLLFNHIFNLNDNSLAIGGIKNKLLYFLQGVNNKLREHQYTELFIVFPDNYCNKILLFDKSLLDKK